MALSKDDRKMFDRLNKRYKVFKKKGVTSNAWELIQNELLNVYMEAADKRGMDISRINFKQNLFTLSKNVDPETLAQMKKIAEYAENTKSTSFAYYKKNKGAADDRIIKAFQTMRNQGDVDTLQDYIDFVDTVKQAKNDVGGLVNKLYDRVGKRSITLLNEAKDKGISNRALDDIMQRALATAMFGDPLLSWLKNEIDKVYSENDDYKKMYDAVKGWFNGSV